MQTTFILQRVMKVRKQRNETLKRGNQNVMRLINELLVLVDNIWISNVIFT